MIMNFISIHAPHAGSDSRGVKGPGCGRDFNPRSPCGERPGRRDHAAGPGDFNPRSPCGERLAFLNPSNLSMRFQSTLPMRGATPKGPNRSRRKTISIHAPHAGSDSILKVTCQVIFNFNPRSPCGERHHYHDCYRQKYKFQSTLPMRGAT